MSQKGWGVNLPDFFSYHRAFILWQAGCWTCEIISPFSPLWLELESTFLLPFTFKEVLSLSSFKSFLHSPVLKHTVSLIRSMFLPTELSAIIFLKMPLWYNFLIQINNRPIFWRAWKNKGLMWVYQIFQDNAPLSFPSFCHIYHCPKYFYSRFSLLMNGILDHYFSIQSSPSQSLSPLVLLNSLVQAPKASVIYKYFLKPDPARTKSKVDLVWGKDLGVCWDVGFWDKIWAHISKISRSASVTQYLFFIYHRHYFTPVQSSPLMALLNVGRVIFLRQILCICYFAVL